MAGPASEPKPWTLNTLLEDEARQKRSTGSEEKEGDKSRRWDARLNMKIQSVLCSLDGWQRGGPHTAGTVLLLHSPGRGPPTKLSSGSKPTQTAWPLGERDDGESYSQSFKQTRIFKHTVKLKHLLGRMFERLFTKESSQLFSVFFWGRHQEKSIYM